MTKSQLIECIAAKVPHIPPREVEAIVNAVFERMAQALLAGERIELRGFGSFTVRVRPARVGRNPRTGQLVSVPQRRTLSFTVGKELRERIKSVSPAPAPDAPAAPELEPVPRSAVG